MAKIIMAEDDIALNRLVKAYLKNAGFEVESYPDGKSALDGFFATGAALVLTDIMMPVMDGYELAEEIRRVDKKTPIVFMSAKDDKPSKMYGYTLGIDDYVTKPFDNDELVMKIKAVLRRTEITENNRITVGNLEMDTESREAYIAGESVPMTKREFDILFKLLSHPQKAFTRTALMDEFWDYDSSATGRTVDVYIAKLREKTAACDGFDIVTVHGLGYKAVLK